MTLTKYTLTSSPLSTIHKLVQTDGQTTNVFSFLNPPSSLRNLSFFAVYFLNTIKDLFYTFFLNSETFASLQKRYTPLTNDYTCVLGKQTKTKGSRTKTRELPLSLAEEFQGDLTPSYQRKVD
jgi:hypothetical protein